MLGRVCKDARASVRAYGMIILLYVEITRRRARESGFGFAEMPDSRAAHSAMDALNGTQVACRALTVNEARPREPWRALRQPRW